MSADDVSEIFARLGRLTDSLERKAGNGTEWQYTFPDGSTHTYKLSNLRSPELVVDDISNLLVWLWSAKDYLKSLAAGKGGDPGMVERAIGADAILLICGDLANGLKHAGLRKSRSDKYPRLGKLHWTAPQQSVESIAIKAFEVQLVFGNPDLVRFSMPVLSRDGEEIGDAFELAATGIKAMERIRERIEQGPGQA